MKLRVLAVKLLNTAAPLLCIVVLLVKLPTTTAPLVFSVAPNMLVLLTRLATVACPVDCKFVPTTLVLLFKLATITLLVAFSVPVVMFVLAIRELTAVAPATLTALRKLAIPPTSKVLRGSATPRPTSPLESIRMRSVYDSVATPPVNVLNTSPPPDDPCMLPPPALAPPLTNSIPAQVAAKSVKI